MTKVEKQQCALRDAILDCMSKQNVAPQDVLTVLGGGCIRFLVPIADLFGYGEKEIVKAFGEGLLTAEIELNN